MNTVDRLLKILNVEGGSGEISYIFDARVIASRISTPREAKSLSHSWRGRIVVGGFSSVLEGEVVDMMML